MRDRRLTIADVRALKGRRQLVMVRTETMSELEAAAQAGVDMVSVTPEMILDPAFRELAATVFAVPGLDYFDYTGPDDVLRWSLQMMKAGADAVYVNSGLRTVRLLADERVPVIGHVGLIPALASWTGGFRAVGKTADAAMGVYEATKALEEAGAFGAELEVVPAAMAAEIAGRTSLFMISMGSGSGADAQYLFACDILGENRGHVPRHAKQYRNLAAELDRLQAERVAAISEFVDDVRQGRYPETRHEVAADPGEVERFRSQLAAREG
jgi:3-methyl-2-oxobutanoate hydroxymethyltransferase